MIVGFKTSVLLRNILNCKEKFNRLETDGERNKRDLKAQPNHFWMQ